MHTKRMEAKILSCLILLASAYATTPDDCEESQSSGIGYHASGSAHSSQYVLPNGQVVTHSKSNSFSSDGIHKTFEELKHEANQFVSKQKDTFNIPNTLPPLRTGLGQDQYFQNGFNFLDHSIKNQKILNEDGSIQYSIPHTSQILSTKKEQIQVNKKISTHGSSLDNEEIELGQNGLDANVKNDQIYVPYPLVYDKVHQSNRDTEHVENINVQQPIRAVQKVQTGPAISESYSKLEKTIKQNASQIIPEFYTYIPTNKFTTGIINFKSNSQDNIDSLNPFISHHVPKKIQAPLEQHYSEKSESSLNTDTIQKENKFNAIPVGKNPEIPIKIKYLYDGKQLYKTEEYTSGQIKTVPTTTEEQETIIKEIQNSELYHSQQEKHTKSENIDGYHYPKANPSTSQFYQKQQEQSSQTITSSSKVPIDQFIHLPLPVEPQKQLYSNSQIKTEEKNTQFSGNSNLDFIPIYIQEPAASQTLETKSESLKSQSTQTSEGIPTIPILIRGEPQPIPLINQQSGGSFQSNEYQSSSHYSGPKSSSGGKIVFPQSVPSQTGSSFQSNGMQLNSHYSGSKSSSRGDIVFPSEYSNKGLSSQSSLNSAFDKLENFKDHIETLCTDCTGGMQISNTDKLPLKTSYGISTSFSSSSTNINGAKSENRKASVAVNDNGKIRTYNTES